MKIKTRILLLFVCLAFVGSSFFAKLLFESPEKKTVAPGSHSPLAESAAVDFSDALPAVEGVTEEPDGVANSIDHLRSILRDENFSAVESAMENLTAMLRDGKFDELMAYFQRESDPDVLAYLAQILGGHFASAGAELQAAILEMAKGDPLGAKRTAALSLLSAVKDPSPEMLATVAALSRDDFSRDVRLNAIYTLSHWADNPARWGEVSDQLVKTIDASDDPLLRGNAIQVIALRGGAATDTVLAAMVDYLENDPTPKNRGIAALALGDAPPELRKAALLHLETAFMTEPDLDIRRNIMTHIARAGEADAVPILLQLTVDHPLLEQDVIDYVNILQAGDIEPDEIYQHKFILDAERDTIVGSSTQLD